MPGEWVSTPIASCNACGASWEMPKDEPHACVAAERDEARADLDRLLDAIAVTQFSSDFRRMTELYALAETIRARRKEASDA